MDEWKKVEPVYLRPRADKNAQFIRIHNGKIENLAGILATIYVEIFVNGSLVGFVGTEDQGSFVCSPKLVLPASIGTIKNSVYPFNFKGKMMVVDLS